ncbi:MAG: endonuclease/exonuclease/phosphatase family protein [Planctomycetaceae bacterium]|nr:endonuclease/exonuclease/phosphatase family protein [Planctomycetaceae bacterium]
MTIILPACRTSFDTDRRRLDFGDSAPGRFTLMTFNLRYGSADDGPNRWDLRRQSVVDLLAAHKPDVIGLQEVLDFQARQLRHALPQYGLISTGRDDGESAGEACSILYRRDRFHVADSGTFWFSNTPWQPSKHWGNKFVRICTWTRLVETANGKSFYFYNLHLDHESQPSRQQSVRLLARQIANRPVDAPYVVAGDFNMSLNNPAMLYLQKIGFDSPYPALTDIWQMVYPDQPAGGTFHNFTGDDSGEKIDHILVPAQTSVFSVQIDTRTYGGRYPSDHFPMIAAMQLYD